MKLPTLLLLGSLAVNAAVIALYVTKSPAADSGAALAGSTAKDTAATRSGAGITAAEAAQTAALAQTLTQLQSGDIATLVSRLRAAGFSPAMIRTIVAAQVSEEFAARRKALLAAREETPFWKSQRIFDYDPKTQAALRELGKEQSNRLKALLGPDALAGDDMQSFYQRRQYGDIPRGKIDQIQSITSDYNDLTQEIYAKTNGLVMLAEDREKIAFLEKEKLADLAKVLTPQELEDYQLRNSNVANQLRFSLTTFNATEAEFRAIYRANAAVEAELGPLGNVRTSDDMRKRQDATMAQLQGIMPPERLAELKFATDPEYQQINRLVARLELPPATSQTVVALQKDMQQRATAVRTDRALAPEAKNTQLAALNQEATAKLTTTLGTRGFEAYKQNGGYWLQNLQPRPAPNGSGTTTTTTIITRPGG
jgi:hypothetical protein